MPNRGSLSPLIYSADGVEFPSGPIIGDPADYTYRVAWSQVIPRRMEFWQPDIMPIVTTDRTILVKHGYGEPNLWGTPCILGVVALRTPQLCCINIHAACYTHDYRLWWYCRVTDTDLHTIGWTDFTRTEQDLLAAAGHEEPLRSMLGGRDTEYRRIPIIYQYPAKGEHPRCP